MRDEPKELEEYLYEEGDLMPEDLFAPMAGVSVEDVEREDDEEEHEDDLGLPGVFNRKKVHDREEKAEEDRDHVHL